MAQRRVLVAAVVGIAFLGGCSRTVRRQPVADRSAALSGEASPAGRDTAGAARALALAAATGTALVDREIEAYERAVERRADDPELWTSLGRAWVKKARASNDPGFYASAGASAEMALAIDPRHAPARNLKALVAMNDHRFADARDEAAQILTRDPDDLLALATMSDALLELGRFDESLVVAQKMMDLKPNLPSYTRAAYLRWLQGDAATAKAFYKRALDARDERDPEPGAWALVSAATLFWHEGDYAGADRGFDEALKIAPDYAPALVGKGRVALARGDGPTAAALFARAHQRSPLVETAWLLGDARALAGDERGAREAYDRAVRDGRQLDPRTLALFWATKNTDRDEAVRLAEAERRVRDDIYTEDVCAWALYRAGRLAEARAASDRALALGTKDARLVYHAGAIRIAMGDAEGRHLVERALALNPNFDVTGAAEAAKLLGAR